MRVAIVLAAAVLLGVVPAAHAQAPSVPYDFDGRTIRLMVPSAAGGAADLEMRLISQHIVKYLDGTPNFVVQNVGGAGGRRMLEFLAQLDPVAEPAMAVLSSTLPFIARAGGLARTFDPNTTNWVGGYLRSTSICVVGTRSGIASIDDLRTADFVFGGNSATGTGAANYAILQRAFGLRIVPVFGYDTTANLALAVSRDEIDGACGPYSTLPTVFQQFIDSGDMKLLLYLGAERRDDLGVPYAYDLPNVAGTDDFLAAVRTAIGFSRPLAIPAGADPAFVEAMRTAFDRVMADPEFVAAAARLNIDLAYRSAADIAAETAALYATPDTLIEEIKTFLYEN